MRLVSRRNTIQGVLESHGPCESVELSKVELQRRKRNSILCVGGRCGRRARVAAALSVSTTGAICNSRWVSRVGETVSGFGLIESVLESHRRDVLECF